MRTFEDHERVVLGWCLIDADLARQVRDGLTREMFDVDAHKFIFDAVTRLLASGDAVDIVTVGRSLRIADKLGEVGGPTYLAEIQNRTTIREHFGHHVAQVRKDYFSRELVKAAHRIAENPEEERVEEMQRLALARSAAMDESYFNFSRDIGGVLAGLEKENPTEQTLRLGFPMLDTLAAGFKPGDLLTVAGRPGRGKTACMTKIATNMADQGLSVVIFSTEMDAQQLACRILPYRAGVEAWRLRQGKLGKPEAEKLTEAAATIHEKWRLFVYDTARPGIPEIRRALVKHQPDVLVIDYLQRCELPRAENHTRSMDAFMTNLKTLAKEYKTLGILGCQLNRGVDRSTPDSRPTLADLRDSGSIEAESDQVILLYSASKQDETGGVRKIEANLAKNRHGETGVIDLELVKDFVEVREAEGRELKTTPNRSTPKGKLWSPDLEILEAQAESDPSHGCARIHAKGGNAYQPDYES